MTIPLAKRPLSDIPCACGCGRLARVNSKLHSAQCEPAYHAIRCRELRRSRDSAAEHCDRKKLSWKERRQVIIDKYGVGRHES